MDKHLDSAKDVTPAIATQSLSHAANLSELQKPLTILTKKSGSICIVSAYLFVTFLVNPLTDIRWINTAILTSCLIALVVVLLGMISLLQKRVEALTSLLLEQQDH